MPTNTTMYLLCLGTLKKMLKIFKLFTYALGIENNLNSSSDGYLLLSIKSKLMTYHRRCLRMCCTWGKLNLIMRQCLELLHAFFSNAIIYQTAHIPIMIASMNGQEKHALVIYQCERKKFLRK